MNLLEQLGSSFCVRMVITMVHFLWQATAIALVAGVAGVLLRKSSPTVRYWLFLTALLLMAACPVATFPLVQGPSSSVTSVPNVAQASVAQANDVSPAEGLLISPSTPSHSSGAMPVPLSRGVAAADEPAAKPTAPVHAAGQELPPSSAEYWKKFTPIATACYLLGVTLLLVRLLIGLHGGRRLRQASQPVTDGRMLEMLAGRAKALGLRFTPAVAYCRRVGAPIVVGVFRPMVLLPLTVANGLSVSQVEAVLAHELAHIRRYDLLVNLVQRLIETFLFYHPAVWFVSRRIRVERENCCDDMAVLAGAEPFSYAESLLHLTQASLAKPPRAAYRAAVTVGAADQPSLLRRRIVRLLGGREEGMRLTRSWPLVVLLLVAAAALFSVVAPGHSQSPVSSPVTTQAATQSAPASAPAMRGATSEVGRSEVVLPSGVRLELLGVARQEGRDFEKQKPLDGPWWGPDGSSLAQPPQGKVLIDRHVSSPGDVQSYKFLARVTWPLQKDQSMGTPGWPVWNIRGQPGQGLGGYIPPTPPTSDLHLAIMTLPKKMTATEVVISMPVGPWRTVAAISVPDRAPLLTAPGVAFPRIEEANGRTSVTLCTLRTIANPYWRLVAVDDAGKEHLADSAAGVSISWKGNEFALPLAKIRQVQFQVRPLQSARFQDVSLSPDRQTQAKAGPLSPPDRREIFGFGRVFIPNLDYRKRNEGVVLDLNSGRLLPLPDGVLSRRQICDYYTKAGEGHLAYDGQLISLHDNVRVEGDGLLNNVLGDDFDKPQNSDTIVYQLGSVNAPSLTIRGPGNEYYKAQVISQTDQGLLLEYQSVGSVPVRRRPVPTNLSASAATQPATAPASAPGTRTVGRVQSYDRTDERGMTEGFLKALVTSDEAAASFLKKGSPAEAMVAELRSRFGRAGLDVKGINGRSDALSPFHESLVTVGPEGRGQEPTLLLRLHRDFDPWGVRGSPWQVVSVQAKSAGEIAQAIKEFTERTSLPPKPGEPAWGKTVNGLQAAVQRTSGERSYKAGEVIMYEVLVRNVGKQNISVEIMDWPWNPFLKDGVLSLLSGQIIDGDASSPRAVQIAPGQTISYAECRYILRAPSEKVASGPRFFSVDMLDLPPGKYEVTSDVMLTDINTPRRWDGTLHAGKLTLEVLTDKGAPATQPATAATSLPGTKGATTRSMGKLSEPVKGPPATMTTEQILAGVKAARARIKDFKVSFFFLAPDEPTNFLNLTTTMLLKGDKFNIVKMSSSSSPGWTSQGSFDGKRAVSYGSDGQAIVDEDRDLVMGSTRHMGFFDIMWWNPKELREKGSWESSGDLVQVLEAGPTVRPSTEIVDGRTCHVIEAHRWDVTITIWLDVERGYLPVRTTFREPDYFTTEFEIKRAVEAEKGLWFATRAIHRTLPGPKMSTEGTNVPKGGIEYVMGVENYSTKPAISVNTGIPDNAFDLLSRLPPGTKVWDRKTSRHWIAGMNGEHPASAPASAPATQPGTAVKLPLATTRSSISLKRLDADLVVPGGTSQPAGLALMLEGAEITDASLAHLKGARLESLMLYQTAVTDDGLAKLSQVASVKTLRLRTQSVKGPGLVHMKDVMGLESLELIGANVGEASLVHLTGLSGLRGLSIPYMPLTDAGLTHIGQMKTLRQLNMYGCQITDNGLAFLGTLKDLEGLDLTDTRVTDAGLRHLRAMTSLKALRVGEPGSLDRKGVTDAGLVHLSGLVNLETLDLTWDTGVTDAGMKHLVDLKHLKSLDLNGTRVSGRALSQFKGIESLSLGANQAEAALEELRAMKGLSQLIVSAWDPLIAAKLISALPNCNVIVISN